MSIIDPTKKHLGPYLRGKLGRPDLPDPEDIAGIYQVRHTKQGKIVVRLPFYAPTGDPSEAQIENREAMRVCVLSWQSLNSSEKLSFNKRGKHRKISGYNLFLSECLSSS